ncbi:NAD(P)-binding domain-containing protein [Streptomyces sp. NPDC050636]|uniref:NADPH-dependent F420 reductase n=1 Tax=Streptomyces sp. NPDC050636 TaxID=3154510 RepID=UPI0034323B4A
MKIAVLGTGAVGRAHAARLTALGHQVIVGTRNPQATRERATADSMGTPPFAAWQEQHPHVPLAHYAGAAAGADLLINATAGATSLEALTAAGDGNLAGKVLIDTATPNDFTTPVDVPLAAPWGGSAPLLNPVGSDSLAEQIQRAFPDVKVVKAVNTVAAHLMTDPASLGGGDHTLFVAGNDHEAKRQATELMASYGWQDIIDLGDLPAARATEMLQPLYLSLARTLGHEHFNLKVIR